MTLEELDALHTLLTILYGHDPHEVAELVEREARRSGTYSPTEISLYGVTARGPDRVSAASAWRSEAEGTLYRAGALAGGV